MTDTTYLGTWYIGTYLLISRTYKYLGIFSSGLVTFSQSSTLFFGCPIYLGVGVDVVTPSGTKRTKKRKKKSLEDAPPSTTHDCMSPALNPIRASTEGRGLLGTYPVHPDIYGG